MSTKKQIQDSLISEYQKEKLEAMELKSELVQDASKIHNSATLQLKKSINDLNKVNALTFDQWKINKSQLELILN